MSKKIMSLLLVSTIIISGTVHAFAATYNNTKMAGPCGDAMTDKPLTIEEQKQALINNPKITAENKARFLKNLNYIRIY